MNLYFISALETGAGDMNMDLLVGANDPDEAVMLWRGYYQHGTDEWPDHVFLVPMPTKAKALYWHTDLIDQVVRGQCVEMATKALGLKEEDDAGTQASS